METNTQLATVQPDNAVLAQGGLGIDESSIKPEAMILVQPTTKDLPKGTPAGIFFDKTSGMSWEKVVFVPIHMTTVRDKYPSKTYKPNEKATCKSRDGLVPITNSKFLVAEAPNCQVCEFSKWDNNKTGKEAAPQCRESYVITFIETETKLPFFIKLTGTSVKVGKKLKEAINRQAVIMNARAKAGEPKASFFDFAVEMGTTNAGDSAAFQVTFPRVQRMTPDKAAEFGPLYLQIIRERERRAQLRAVQGEDEAVDAAAGDVIDAEYDDVPQVEV